MSEYQDPNMEVQALSDDDLDSVSGGRTTTNAGGSCTTNNGGFCHTNLGGDCTTNTGGTCTNEPPRQLEPVNPGTLA